jgi:phosphatidylglycerol---prolipoprotein diacylglyceryl transferase
VILGIDWKMSSQLIEGWSVPNLYGLLFVTGLIIGYFVIKRIFDKEGVPEAWLDSLLIYIVIATVVGARLGHVFFYEWDYYKDHLSEIPKVWEGGLASHGGAVAILIALFIYSKKVSKLSMFWILDRIVAPIAIAGCFIRLGNLVNHEIVGVPTDLPWGFKFWNEGVDNLVFLNGEFVHVFRHPAQLYEAIAYFLIFLVLLRLFWKTNLKQKQGFIFGVFLIVLWGARFLIEFVKIGQAARDEGMILNTGQWLSVPFIIAGFVIIYLANKGKLGSSSSKTKMSAN